MEYAPDGAWHVQYGEDKAGYERAKKAQRSRGTCVKVTYHAVGGGGSAITLRDAVGGGAVADGGSGHVCHGVVDVLFRHFSGKRGAPEGKLVWTRYGRGYEGGTGRRKWLRRV